MIGCPLKSTQMKNKNPTEEEWADWVKDGAEGTESLWNQNEDSLCWDSDNEPQDLFEWHWGDVFLNYEENRKWIPRHKCAGIREDGTSRRHRSLKEYDNYTGNLDFMKGSGKPPRQ